MRMWNVVQTSSYIIKWNIGCIRSNEKCRITTNQVATNNIKELTSFLCRTSSYSFRRSCSATISFTMPLLVLTRTRPAYVQQSATCFCRLSWRIRYASMARLAVRSSFTWTRSSLFCRLWSFRRVRARARNTSSRTASLRKRTMTARLRNRPCSSW